MDIFTLIICTALISLSTVVTLAVLLVISPEERYLVDWLIAGVCFFLSNATGLILTLSAESDPFFPMIANGFYMAAHTAVMSGISLLVLNKNIRKLIPLAFLITIGLHGFDSIMSSVESRIMTFYPMMIALTVAGLLILFLKKGNREDGKAFHVLIFTLVFFLVQLILRFPLLLNDDLNLMLAGNDFMQTSGTLFLMLYIFLLTISFSTIVIWRKEIRLRNFAFIDELSGWLNRKSLEKRVTVELNRTKREGGVLSFIMIDIDYFKTINDLHGHAAGDAAIQHVCRLAEQCKRDYDLNFRVGGEEFLIVAPDTSEDDAGCIAERIREKVANTPLSFRGNDIALTVSIGVASSITSIEDWRKLYEHADNALYSSKDNGRNKVTCSNLAQALHV
jgi:diguanylate cyclase (GGDEF)-like protein